MCTAEDVTDGAYVAHNRQTAVTCLSMLMSTGTMNPRLLMDEVKGMLVLPTLTFLCRLTSND